MPRRPQLRRLCKALCEAKLSAKRTPTEVLAAHDPCTPGEALPADEATSNTRAEPGKINEARPAEPEMIDKRAAVLDDPNPGSDPCVAAYPSPQTPSERFAFLCDRSEVGEHAGGGRGWQGQARELLWPSRWPSTGRQELTSRTARGQG